MPAVTAAYLNITQMWHLQRLLGKENSRYYVKIMAFLIISSNGYYGMELFNVAPGAAR